MKITSYFKGMTKTNFFFLKKEFLIVNGKWLFLASETPEESSEFCLILKEF